MEKVGDEDELTLNLERQLSSAPLYYLISHQVYLPGFLSSNLYYKYLSDLINSVRADEFVQLGAQGQTAPADNDRSGSNSGEGPQAQVRPLTL